MRTSLLILFAVALLTIVFRADSLLSAACNNALFVSLNQELILQSQGQSALGMITAEEWQEQPEAGAHIPDFCFQEAFTFGQGLSALWQRKWQLADSRFEKSDRGVLTDMGSYTAAYILDDDDRTMGAQTADYFMLKGDLFMRSGEPEIAEVYFQESLDNHPTIEGWLGLARAYGNQGLLDKKVAALEAAQLLDLSAVETRYLLAMARFEENNQAAEAKTQLVDIVNEFTLREPKDHVLLYRIYLDLAELDGTLGYTENGIEWLTLAFNLPFVQTHLAARNISRLYLELEQYNDARAWQRKFAALRSDEAEPYILAADISADQGKLADAAGNYEKAISLMSEPKIITYVKLAQVYEQSGRDQDARETWEQVLDLDPGNQRAKRALEK